MSLPTERNLHFREVREFLDAAPPRDYSERIPIGLYEKFLRAIDELLDYSFTRDDETAMSPLVRQKRRLSVETTIGEAKDILYAIGSIGASTKRDISKRLERRIMDLERNLLELRSNPALEKKVSQMERELEKLKATSVNLEGEEKQQKDMLKNFKEAEKKVFVIMPFAPMFDDIWRGGIERACNTEEMGCLRVDQINLSSWITEDIKEYMKMADFVIIDITGNNPNVMFELGWALALEKKPIVIRQKDDPSNVPFDVKDLRYIQYASSWSGVEKLHRDICKFLKSTEETLKTKPTSKKEKMENKTTK